MDNSNLKKKVFSGLIWTYAERLTAQLVSLCVSIVLARMIAPEHYGIIAVVIIFINLANVFVAGGLGNALVQKKNSDEIDFSSMFWFNLALGICLYLLLFFSAPLVSKIYKIDQLTLVLRVMGLRIPVAAINSIQQAYISKRMEFKKFFIATLFGTVISGIVGILMALNGFGVWALVTQYLLNSTIDTVLVSITSGWKPIFVFEWNRVKGLVSYGWKILSTQLLIQLYTDIKDIIIGIRYTTSDLAYSNKGQQFPSIISVNINTSISKVMFPALSNVQDNFQQLKNMTRRAVQIGTYLLAPILIGLAIISPTFVEVVLTEKWVPCVPFLRLMCIYYLFQPIQTASLQAMKAVGRSDLYLKLEIIKKIVGIIILVLCVFYGNNVLTIIVGVLLSELSSTVINFPVNKKLFGYSYHEQVVDILPPVFISLGMIPAVALIKTIQMNSIVSLVLQILSGAVVYILISVISRNKSFTYLLAFIKKKNQI